MSEWYLVRHGSRDGPFSTDDIRKMARDGTVKPFDMLWREDLQRNIRANQIKGLFQQHDPATSPESLPPAPPEDQPPSSSSESSEGERDDLSSLADAATETIGSDAAMAGKSVGVGIGYAKAAVAAGANKLKSTFGASLKATLASGNSAAGHFRKHPLRFTIATFVLVVGCGLSMIGFITLILVPVFVMGYIVYMDSLIAGQKPSFALFISFMRHGWNSVWHLFMMLASFFVTTALIMCPGIIIGLVLWLGVGTIGAGIGQIGQSASSNKATASETRYDLNRPYEPRDYSATSEEPGAVHSFFSRVGAEALTYVIAAVVGVILVLVFTPLVALMILHFFFARDVACSKNHGQSPFSLVYDSFGRMLQMGRTQWQRLLCSGLFLSVAVAMGMAACLLLGRLFGYMHCFVLSMWAGVVLLPFVLVVFGVYSNVFLVTTCLNLSQRLESSVANEPQEGLSSP